MSLNDNPKYDKSSGIETGMFGILFVLTLILLALYLPSYINNNPPVCIQESSVKEIISISGNKATLKINNDTIINTSLEKYDKKEKRLRSYIKIGEPVCLKYKSLFDYYLSIILLSF